MKDKQKNKADLVEIGSGTVRYEGTNGSTAKITLSGQLRDEFLKARPAKVKFYRNTDSGESFVVMPETE